MSNVFTIIVTYNSMKWINKCLENLHESSIHTEIVVVDNCSTDETISFIKLNYPKVHIIVNNKNVGFGQANNIGIEYAYHKGATNFFLCNQDLYINEKTLEELLNVQEQYNVDIVSPMQLNGEFSALDGGFYFDISSHQNFRKFVSDLYTRKLDYYYYVDFVPAAAWMINKSTIEKIGGFDPIFFHYGEDYHYSRRLLYHKMKMAIVPSSRVGHDRIFKGNIDAFNKYSALAILTNAYADPNDPILVPTFKRIKANLIIIRNIFKALFALNFKKFSSLSSSYFVFLKKLNNIAKSVRCNRKIDSNWLNL